MDEIDIEDELVYLEPRETFDAAIIGTADRFGSTSIAYDANKVIAILMEDGITHEEAEEYFEFNILGAYVGDSSPTFITPM